MNTTCDITNKFEQGVREYFDEFGGRVAKERTHQLWLGTVLARHISIHRILAEFDVPMRDVFVDTPLDSTSPGVANFDFCIARGDQVDAQLFWTRTRHKRDAWDDTTDATLRELKKVSLIAELKTATTASNRTALRGDLLKMCGVLKFLKRNGAAESPDCFLVVFDPERKLPVLGAWADMRDQWPEGVPELRILVGPPYERLNLQY